MQLTALLLSALITGAAPAPSRAPSAAKLPRLAVMPLSGEAVPAEARALLGNILADAFARHGAHEVLGPDEVSAVLTEAGKPEAVRCADVLCAYEVAGGLTAPQVLLANVARLGGDLVVELRLVDAIALRVLKRSHVNVGPVVSKLDVGMRDAAAALLADNSAASSSKVPSQPPPVSEPIGRATAKLRVSASVEGARIFIDDRQVGTTPTVLEVKPGRHDLAIEKRNHTAYSERLSLAPGEYKSRNVIIKNVAVERTERRNRILLGSLMTAFSIAGVATGILMMRSGFRTMEDGANADEALTAMGQLFGGEMLTIYGTLLIAGGIALLVTTPRLGAEPTHLGGDLEAEPTDAVVGADTGALLQLRLAF